MFGEHFRLEKISKQGNPLERLNSVINWEAFEPVLQKLENRKKKSDAGAKPYPLLLMFKILILQRYYNLSDNQIEYQILDRLSFGFIEGSINKFYLNCIGIKRASATIGLINLTYNLFRYEQLVRLHRITMSNY